ncbi:hypothetical protein QFC21_005638 [Naganishia friedmannii]|uniref:Uncharacterized protein n=1 Tax=Naganishia friedmannii TaxID=89922 RepID=A0ACC2V7K4_9TREE|nr:hypothetical protein QFC21_005638 [Naganishia friedmannii]
MICTNILQCLALFGFMYGVAALPASHMSALARRDDGCGPDQVMWKWSTKDAIQDVIDAEAANISRNDCAFRHGLDFGWDLFNVDGECGISFSLIKKLHMEETRGNQSLTLAPIVYERAYRAIQSELPNLLCKDDDNAACAWSNALSFFSHSTPLQLTEVADVQKMASDMLKKVFDGAGLKSPVLLKDADSIVIITGSKTIDSWTGFDVSDPRTIKTWTASQLQEPNKISVAYAPNQGTLALNGVRKPCAWSGLAPTDVPQPSGVLT